MSYTLSEIQVRAEHQCELCKSSTELSAYAVEPVTTPSNDTHALLCAKCIAQIEEESELDLSHWNCLRESAWTQVPAVQVLVYRLLHQLKTEDWAQELSEQIYLEDEVRTWAEAGITPDEIIESNSDTPVDCNGVALLHGDSVSIIKNLEVKGSSIVAKRGTAVRNIRLTDDPTHIEGRVNGVSIYLKTCFLKKI